MIELKSLGKKYINGKVENEVLKNIHLKIEDGEFVAVMGPSGSGKSTLLKIIGLMDYADKGKYFLDGQDVTGVKRKQMDALRKDKMAFVFQNFALMKERTVYENVELPLIAKKTGLKKRREMIYKTLEMLSISELENKKASHISGGQQQRCAIARAIAADNPYVLADEPTGALDSHTGKETVQLLREIAQTGKTVIMVTHDALLAEYADRIIRIKDGEIYE